MAQTPPESANRTGWPMSAAASGSFGNESAGGSVGFSDTFAGLEDFIDDDEALGAATASAVSMEDSVVRRRLRVRTTSIPGARVDLSVVSQVQRDRASLGHGASLGSNAMRYASNGITLAPSSVLQVELYGRQWNITLPSPSAAVQLLIVLACLASQLLLFGDILYQLLMLAITFVVQGLMLFFLHSGLHLRQRAASGYYSIHGIGKEQEHLGRAQGQTWRTHSQPRREPLRSGTQQWNPFFERGPHAESFRELGTNTWRRIWAELMSLISSGDIQGMLHALVESKAFLLQRLLITVFWCALYVHFTKYLYRDEVCDRGSYETTFIHALIGYEWRCKWLTDRIPDWHVPVERVFLWIVNIDFCVSLITAREKFKWIKRLSTVLDIFTMPLFMLFVRWGLAIDPEDYLSLYGYMRFMRLYGLHRTLERIATSTSEITLKIVSISLGVLGIIFTFSGAMFNEEAPAGLKGEFTAFFDYVYFFVVTLSTVGYGDFAPVTGFGRLLCINAIGIVVIFIPAQIRELGYLIRQPRGQIGVIPSRKVLGVDGKFVLLLAGGLSADELDTFIWELAHGHTLYCRNVVVFTTSPVKDFEETVSDALSKFGIRLCIKAGDTASGVSQDLCKLRWDAVGAVIVFSDRRCGTGEAATPLSSEQVSEDHRSVVRCLHVRKFWDQAFGLSCHLLREDSSRQVLDMGAEQVTSRHDLMLKIMAKTCSGYLHGAFMCVYRITCPPFVATAMPPYKYEELLLLLADHSRVCLFGIDRMASTGHMLLNPAGQELTAADGLIILASSARKALEIQALGLNYRTVSESPFWSELDRDRMRLFIPARFRMQGENDDVSASQTGPPHIITATEVDETRSPERHHADTASIRESRGTRRYSSGDEPIVFPIPGMPESVSEVSEDQAEGTTKKKRSASAGAVLTRDMSDRLAHMGLADGQTGGAGGSSKRRGLRRQNTFFTTGRRALKAVRSMGSIFGPSPQSSSGTTTRRPSGTEGEASPSRRFRGESSAFADGSLDVIIQASLPTAIAQGAEKRGLLIEQRKNFVSGATRLRLQPVYRVDKSRIIFEDFLEAFPELTSTLEGRMGDDPDFNFSIFDPSGALGFTATGPSLVVVVGWPNGLPCFLRTIFSSKGSAKTKCVVLSPNTEGSIAELSEFAGRVAWVLGSPTSREDLARAGVGAADVVAVLTSISSWPGVARGPSRSSLPGPANRFSNPPGSSARPPPQDFISALTTHEIKHVKDKVKSSGRCNTRDLDSSSTGAGRRTSVASMFSEDGTEAVRVSRSIITCLQDVTCLSFLDESSWWPSEGVKGNLFHMDSPEFAMGNVISESILFPAISRSPVLSDILVDAGIMASLMIDGGLDFYGDQPNSGIQPCVELVDLSEAWKNERLNAFFAKSNMPSETREQIAASSDPLRIAGATFGDLLKHLVSGGCVPLGLYRRQPQSSYAALSFSPDSEKNAQLKQGTESFDEWLLSGFQVVRLHLPANVNVAELGRSGVHHWSSELF
ncbi:hypothetical protein FOZ61_000011 [Perkinsus olseni]|uniref:Calcium-activated potassium channel subunit alpha-1 n=2 Tax=Perkinsus olseni TaxID=32597 RepID=A0A7J6MIX8_PEROL|nr:hypothetical protein FOZ61_000011 [Perkinsus olseni]KAF4676323.1 hypothetical protein FOL46_004924 [Perkinsus olseni]